MSLEPWLEQILGEYDEHDRAAVEQAMLDAERLHAECDRFMCPAGCCEESIHPTKDYATGFGPVACKHRDDDLATIRSTWPKLERPPLTAADESTS